MGTILPKSVYNSQPTTEDELNKKIWLQKIVNGLSDFANDDVARMTPYRVNQYQRERDAFNQNQLQQQRYAQDFQFRKQQYADALKQQQFRNKLAEQEYQLRLAQAMGRGQQMDLTSPGAALGSVGFRGQPSLSPNTPQKAPSNNPAMYGPELTYKGANELGIEFPAPDTAPTPAPIVTVDNLSDRGKEVYHKLANVQPELANSLINAANYKIPVNEILKDWKNPADRTAINQALYAFNPHYDSTIADEVQRINRDIKNPKGSLGDLATYNELQERNAELQDEIEDLPGGNIPALNHYVWHPVARLWGDRGLANYNQTLDQYTKALEKSLLGGKPTVSSLSSAKEQLDHSLGPDILRSVLKKQQEGFDNRMLTIIRNTYLNTRGAYGLPQTAINEESLRRLQDTGNIVIRPDGIVIPVLGRNRKGNR